MSLPVSLRRARTPRAVLRATRYALPDPSLDRLRVAVAALFVLDGVVFGSWAARVPAVAGQVGATHSALGAALLCLSAGARWPPCTPPDGGRPVSAAARSASPPASRCASPRCCPVWPPPCRCCAPACCC